MNSKKHLLCKLFLSTLYLSAFTFGGGYVIITLMKKKFVDQYHWIKEEEMLDLVAIAQSAPGPIAVNGAIVVGFQLAGLPGVLLCVLATVLPPFVIISILSGILHCLPGQPLDSSASGRIMQSGVAAVIASVVYDMGRGIVQERRLSSLMIMIGVFIANCVFHINAIYMILFCIILGLLQAWFSKGGMSNDLYAAVSQLSENRSFQFRGWLCSSPADPKRGDPYPSLA